MAERVSLIHGNEPIIIVAPHACNEPYMNIIAEEMAKRSNAYALINNGFKVADDVDVMRDLADCNRIEHIREDVVREEFLDPLLATKRALARKHARIIVLSLYGLDSQVEQRSGHNIDVVLGYGQAVVNNSYTCPLWMIDMFINEWESHGWTSSSVYCGKPGGSLSARSIHHLPQLFQKTYPDNHVQVMQILISERFRHDRGGAAFCGVVLANVIEEIAQVDFYSEDILKCYI
jgi:hypothetical protein